MRRPPNGEQSPSGWVRGSTANAVLSVLPEPARSPRRVKGVCQRDGRYLGSPGNFRLSSASSAKALVPTPGWRPDWTAYPRPLGRWLSEAFRLGFFAGRLGPQIRYPVKRGGPPPEPLAHELHRCGRSDQGDKRGVYQDRSHQAEAQFGDDGDLGDRESEEDDYHDGGRSEDHQAGAAEGEHDGLGHVACLVVALAVAAEDEDEVVHGYAEETAEQEYGDVGIDTLDVLVETSAVAVLEDEDHQSVGGVDGEQVEDGADDGEQDGAEDHHHQQEAQAEDEDQDRGRVVLRSRRRSRC